MSNKSGYSEQKNLSSIQLLAEVPTLIETLLSAFSYIFICCLLKNTYITPLRKRS